MGHKNNKRNIVARSKSSAPSSVAALVFPNSDERDSVKNECERALAYMRKTSHKKAMKLMEELTCRYENSPHMAFVHRVQGSVLRQMVSLIADPREKQRHRKKAIESARKAVALSPDSIEFALFYANMLYEAAYDEGKEYDEVVAECERALAIENPIDPKESFLVESQEKFSTANVQSELKLLIQKSKISSNSTPENINGDENFSMEAIDDMVERLEEWRERVTAAKLIQQKSNSPFLQDDADKGFDSNTRPRKDSSNNDDNESRDESTSEEALFPSKHEVITYRRGRSTVKRTGKGLRM